MTSVKAITLSLAIAEFAAAPADFWVYDVCPNRPDPEVEHSA